MSVFINKDEFKDKPKIYNILIALENAHTRQDELACAILLTRLKNENITLDYKYASARNKNMVK